MTLGLAKVAADYSKDPVWNIHNENIEQKEKELLEAQALRDPELVAKEQRAEEIGMGIGAGVGATGGAGLGGYAGWNRTSGRSPALRSASALGHGLVGAGVGALGGGLAGLLGSVPFKEYYRLKEDPEVMQQVNQARMERNEAGKMQREYELNAEYLRNARLNANQGL